MMGERRNGEQERDILILECTWSLETGENKRKNKFENQCQDELGR